MIIMTCSTTRKFHERKVYEYADQNMSPLFLNLLRIRSILSKTILSYDSLVYEYLEEKRTNEIVSSYILFFFFLSVSYNL